MSEKIITQRGFTVEGESVKSKREQARKLMEGKEIEKNEAKALELLEECVSMNDAEAMVMLAKYCVFGHGIEDDRERAKELIVEAAKKGNQEAFSLIRLINYWFCEKGWIDMNGLITFYRRTPSFCNSHLLNLQVMRVRGGTRKLLLLR